MRSACGVTWPRRPVQPPSDDTFLAWECAKDLRTFIREAWPIIEPGTTFRGNWHIDAICEHLQGVADGTLRRLLVNVPPRHSKSTVISVMFPAWLWLTRPEMRFLCASYASRLSTDDSVKCRRIIESIGGQENGTLLQRVGYVGLRALLGATWDLTGDQNEKTKFQNDRQGYRVATSVGGTVTGMGGDVLIIDDPNSADDAESQAKRDAVTEWLDGTMSTRLNDPQKGAIVVVQQRLHQDDATGHLLGQGGYTHLCLPAEYDAGHPHLWDGDPRTEPGELLWGDHFNEEAVGNLKTRLGSRRSAGQLQQLPTPSEGGMFKRDWWQRWQPGFEASLDKGWDACAQSWDMRFTDSKTTGDWVVGGYWGFHGADAYLLGMVRARLSFTESQQAIRDLTEWATQGPHGPFRLDGAKLVEKKANGDAIIQTLRREIRGVLPVNPKESKEARAAAVSPMVEAGNVFLPPGAFIPCPDGYEACSVADFVEEHAAFPLASHDDMVDMVSQVLAWKRPTERESAPAQRAAVARPLAAGIMGRKL